MIKRMIVGFQLSNMNEKEILTYYSTHNVKSTLKKFKITYAELRSICNKNNFTKTSEQLKETYRNTRIEKYGSIEMYREAKKASLERNSFNVWMRKLNEKENENED